MNERHETRVPRPRRFQFTLFTLLIAMTVVAISIALWKYQAQRRAAVRRVYDEQKEWVNQVLEDFRDSIEKDGTVWVSKHTQQQSGSGEWRLSGQLISHKRIFRVGEQEEEALCQFVFQGFVSQDARGKPTWWSNLPLKITCDGGPSDDRFVAFVAERLRAKPWAFEIEKDSALRSLSVD